jgi:hypothetical protein
MKKLFTALVALLFLVAPLMAQGPVSQTTETASGTFTLSSDALFTQMTPTGMAIASQQFPDFSDCYMQAADDFTVPAGQQWLVERVAVTGTMTTMPAN